MGGRRRTILITCVDGPLKDQVLRLAPGPRGQAHRGLGSGPRVPPYQPDDGDLGAARRGQGIQRPAIVLVDCAE